MSATSPSVNKVIDVAIMTNYCHCKNDQHDEMCTRTTNAKSGAMEVLGAVEIYERSLERGVQYGKYLGDGDSRAFKAVKDKNFYPVEKLDCVGHVQKRIGSRLRK